MLVGQAYCYDLNVPDKVCIFISVSPVSSPNLMFDYLLESSHRDDSNKWSNIGFGEEITEVESIEYNFMHLILSSGSISLATTVKCNTTFIKNLLTTCTNLFTWSK